MSQARGIEIRYLESIKGGMAQFFTPQASNETMLVQVPAGAVDDLFVHKSQTDQILVVKGEFVLVTLIDKKYQYIPLSETQPAVVKIPPGVLHGAINFSSLPCVVVNAVLRHRPPQPNDYIPRPRPYEYDLDVAKSALESLSVISTIAGFNTTTTQV
ncbi:dTDP-4-dehydrorhamnose 3,5-epimerase [Calothrix sp. UHCC 0171]|uniref:dTDP-4-dehydrorhamnose 3,5-epimerase n=1 Tax=Calothrix sp. UHCC 0171 TaxID=3110245 RepID=UPI002B1EF3F3|nr:dTDP-4-dehydrorhamnose 3,5-epimerase [Calothrix sp. UHCC 0171]MEA5574229.1 dTDP-4-dehydrorhamnose 3,5-epimerase [Calothrix sp. UHCC 0171]